MKQKFCCISQVCDRAFEPSCEDVEDCEINGLKHCNDLMKVINETSFFDVVFDFSAYQVRTSNRDFAQLYSLVDPTSNKDKPIVTPN